MNNAEVPTLRLLPSVIKNDFELFDALIKNRIVHDLNGRYYRFIDNKLYCSYNRTKWDIVEDMVLSSKRKEYGVSLKTFEEVYWYENIPENGRICWVSDVHNDSDTCVKFHAIAIIGSRVTSLDTTQNFIDKRTNVPWVHAIPLTNEELESFKCTI